MPAVYRARTPDVSLQRNPRLPRADRQKVHALVAAGEAIAGAGVDHDRVACAKLGKAVVEVAAAREHDDQLVVVVLVGRDAEAGEMVKTTARW